MAKLTQETFETICTYMDDEIRDHVHVTIDLPCTPEEFLNIFIKKRSIAQIKKVLLKRPCLSIMMTGHSDIVLTR